MANYTGQEMQYKTPWFPVTVPGPAPAPTAPAQVGTPNTNQPAPTQTPNTGTTSPTMAPHTEGTPTGGGAAPAPVQYPQVSGANPYGTAQQAGNPPTQSPAALYDFIVATYPQLGANVRDYIHRSLANGYAWMADTIGLQMAAAGDGMNGADILSIVGDLNMRLSSGAPVNVMGGAMPAQPAQPAQPAPGGGPATPATPAVPAAPPITHDPTQPRPLGGGVVNEETNPPPDWMNSTMGGVPVHQGPPTAQGMSALGSTLPDMTPPNISSFDRIYDLVGGLINPDILRRKVI